MNLTETPEYVTWPESHYVYIEKIGPFQETAPQAWTALHAAIPAISKNNTITGYMSLYKVKPKNLYRAGVAISSPAVKLPEGFDYTIFKGGKYARFVLTGPYKNLPQACGRVFEIMEQTKIQLRDDFYIENYVNDPRVTMEDALITHILVPVL